MNRSALRFFDKSPCVAADADALRLLGRHWLITAGMHAFINAFLLGVMATSWPAREWPSLLWISSIAVFALLFMAALSASAVLELVREGNSEFKRRGELALASLSIAGAAYVIAWVGMVFPMLAHGGLSQIMSVAQCSVLLGLVSAKFSSVLGTVTRVILLVQMATVIAGVFAFAHEWATFIALGLTFGTVIMLWISVYGSRSYSAMYRLRLRQARLQQRLHHKNELLAETSSSKSLLLAMASHDLRQPVHALGLLVERLRCDAGSSAVRERVEVINNVVQDLSATLEKLMALAKFDSGTVPVHLEPVALDRMFVTLQNEFEPFAFEKGLTLQYESGGLLVYTDATLLRTMMCNLLTNAIRYSDQGTVSATAHLRDDGQTVRIEVSDKGVGIPTERVPDIFEAFIRLGGADPGSEGLGLGLVIVKRAAELLKIPLQVRSELGHGSVFSLDVPLSSSLPDPVLSLSGSTSRLQGLRILLLDNDQVVLASMAQTFEEWGCKIVTGASAADVKTKLKLLTGGLDLIITDYHLGAGVNGVEVIQSLRRTSGVNTPAIILTGDVGIHLDADAGESRTVVAHKPLSPGRLGDLAVKTLALGKTCPA